MISSIFKEKKLAGVVLAGIVLASPVAAMDIQPGCYQRIYSSGHLAGQPAQVVAAMRMKVGDWVTNVSRATSLEVVLANQGHVRGTKWAGRTLSQFLFCGTESRSDTCLAECDGGSLQVRKMSSQGMTFRTRYLAVGPVADCGGYVDLAEFPGEWVSYKLNRVPDAVCEGM